MCRQKSGCFSGISLLFTLICAGTDISTAQWVVQPSGTTARFRGLSAVDPRIAWMSGTGGMVLKTTDGGASWERKIIADAGARDFRDIEAFGEKSAYVLAIGEGSLSRIAKTTDGGTTWRTQFINSDARGFLDALAFWDSEHGLVLGDPVDGRFVILATDDGGATWTRIGVEGMPPARAGEGAFAASGTCLTVKGSGHAWFGTGHGRVFRSDDRGRTWTAHPTPIRSENASSGIFSLAFRDADRGVAVGGDYKEPQRADKAVALTRDGGRTWSTPRGPGPRGYRSAVAYVPGEPEALVAVGPTGSDWSRDGGETWAPLGDPGFHAVSIVSPRLGWGVGDDGRIGRLDLGATSGNR